MATSCKIGSRMRSLSLFSLLVFCFFLRTTNARSNKTGLNALWNLNQMAECRLDYTALIYDNYGCWCGVGGCCKPEDGIDECCQRHDKCYDYAVDQGYCDDVPEEYVDDYTWSCVKGVGGERSEPVCEEGQSKCKLYLCWCDKSVVDCWSQYPRPPAQKGCTHQPESSIKHFFKSVINGIVGFFGTVVDGVESLFRRR